MTYSPNLTVGSGWKATLTSAFQSLKKIKFIVEPDFQWETFDPKVSWNGMAVNTVNVRSARALYLRDLLLFSLDIEGTVGAPLAPAVIVTLPRTAAGDVGTYQSGGASGQDNGVATGQVWQVQGTTNLLYIYRYDFANYTAGVFRGIANGALEVI